MLPVVLIVAGAAILHYAYSRLIYEPLVRIFFVGSWSSLPIIPVNSEEAVIVAVVVAVVSILRARDRVIDWDYWVPPVVLALCWFVFSISVLAREAKHDAAVRQYKTERSDLPTKMQDPTFLMNVKMPLSSARRDAIMSALGDGERVPGTPLSSAEVHAILTVLGSDPMIENGVAASPATSADDLQWVALHGSRFARWLVAENRHTSHETLLRLMNDPDVSYVTGSYIAQKGCDADVIRIFWQRESSRNLPKGDSAFRAMAANPCTPKDILRTLGTFPNPVGPSATETLDSLSEQ